MVIYDYYCLDMSFKELLDKADEMGFKVNKVEIKSVEKFDYSKEKAV